MRFPAVSLSLRPVEITTRSNRNSSRFPSDFLLSLFRSRVALRRFTSFYIITEFDYVV